MKTDSKLYARTLFSCSDVQAGITFYTDKLGFAKAWEYAADGTVYAAQLDRNGAELILARYEHIPVGGGGVYISLHEPEQLEAFFRECRERNVRFESELHTTHWNSREFTVLDPDGNRIVFSA